MRPTQARSLLVAATLVFASMPAFAADKVKTANGIVAGAAEPSGVYSFKGIPFAAPPVGELRWKPPQPAMNWVGVRETSHFAPRCMQRRSFGDMVFRSDGMSEDCLYLNVWTPAKTGSERLPVLVYVFGGGFSAGDGSEPRYDGESMARRGIVAVTVNYRLGVFGFFAHPELTKESPHHASGNQGLLDQTAALAWVQKNIAAFGGDPRRVTIAGESAGSLSVSAQMASPLAKNLIAGAIGESGALINPTLGPVPLADAEQMGVKFAEIAGASSLSALRALTAQQVLDLTGKPGVPRFAATVDGYFLPKRVSDIFAAGEQAHVPLLVGWNSEESNARAVLQQAEPTPENYAAAITRLYGDKADEVLKLYPGSTPEEVLQSATDLSSDRFIAFSTWKWADLHGKTGGKPVYRYFYSHPRPAMDPASGMDSPSGGGPNTPPPAQAPARPSRPRGAVHSSEIEYAMGNLSTNRVYAWTPDDRKVSDTLQGYFANFVKTGDPNGSSLPRWPAANTGDTVQFMRVDVDTHVETDTHRDRYLFLDQVYRDQE